MFGVSATVALAGMTYYLYRSREDRQPQKPVPNTTDELDVKNVGDKVVQEEDVLPDDSEEEEDDELEDFLPVIEALNLRALKRVALQTHLSRLSSPPTSPEKDLTCVINAEPTSGSFNLVYFITFSDGSKMVARLPGKGNQFEELDRKKMDHEYQSMQLIRARTTIPIPEVLTWQTTSHQIGVPFALISFMPGKQICDLWFDETWVSEAKRLRILDQIAEHMSKLHNVEFESGVGAPLFDDRGQLAGVGPIYDYLSGIESPVAWHVIQTSGPWSSIEQYRSDRCKEAEVDYDGDANTLVMRLASESIPIYMNGRGKTYIAHPDFAWHNIFVDDDANITAFIDWDSLTITSCSLGFGRYPSWLTRDWDPAMYGYQDDEEIPDDMVEESTPEELSRYRQHYASAFRRLAVPHYDPRETQLSHVVEAIHIGSGSRLSRDWIVPKLLCHAFRGKVPFNYKDFVGEYSAGNGESTIEVIKEGFAKMWYAEWEASLSEQAVIYRCSTDHWRAMAGYED
jgi:aminoglycoside phosphotransferase (APT) family kinase protein